MNLFIKLGALIFFCLLQISQLQAEAIYVSSQQEFEDAHDTSMINDTIIWRDGIYQDIFMDIDNDGLYIKSETLGQVIFQGASRVDITGDYITLEGFQFIGGDIGNSDVINTRGSYNIFTQINIRAYTCYKYLRVREQSRYCKITFCNFENRLNLDDQNILSILVDNDNPGYHKIQYCSFKNFDGTGNDLGIEPIRIGLSSQAEHIARCLVEYCYFTQCNGDGEIISSKARQNVYRFNTFENNPLAELVLRHGSENIVYGNFFLNNKGGIRVREGQDQYIYNNYFQNLNDRAIYLQNEDSDPLDNINIAFNTFINCAELRLGGSGDNKPTNVTFANNIFTDPKDDRLFQEETGTETWIGNISFGDLGITTPASGLTNADPALEMNSEGYYGLSGNSPAIDAATSGYASLPEYLGIQGIDAELLFDLMGQERPAIINEKDLGCNEFPHEVLIQPIATEENTGPIYETSTSTLVLNTIASTDTFIEISPNPSVDHISIKVRTESNIKLIVEIYNLEGKMIKSIYEANVPKGERNFTSNINDLAVGLYKLRAISQDQDGGNDNIQIMNLIKLD